MCAPMTGGGPAIRVGRLGEVEEPSRLLEPSPDRVGVVGDPAAARRRRDRRTTARPTSPTTPRTARRARRARRTSRPRVSTRTRPPGPTPAPHRRRGAPRRVAKRGSSTSSGRPIAVQSDCQCSSVQRGDAEPTVERRVQAVERAETHLQTVEVRARVEIVGSDERIGGEEHRARQDVGRHPLRGAGAVAFAERLQHADGREQAGGGVAHAEAVPVGVAAVRGRALLVLEPGDRLSHLVDARPPGERPGVAVRREVAVHDARVHRLGLFVSEPEALRDAGAQVVVHDVGGRDQIARDALAVGRLQVDGDGTLAALARGVGRVGFGADPLADRVDLDHVGAEIAQHHRAERAGERGAEVEHADPVEGMRERSAIRRAVRRPIGGDVGRARRGPRRCARPVPAAVTAARRRGARAGTRGRTA